MEKKEKVVVTTDDDEQQKTKNYSGIKAMPFVIGNETFEKLGTLGTSNNLLVYLTTVFNMQSITAVTLLNVFHGSTNFATLIGAFLSDTYFGRYYTLGFASVSSFLGMLIITLTAAVHQLHPPQCGSPETAACLGPTPGQTAFLVSGFGFLVIGAGGIRPCNLAFGADQFNPDTESGKRGISSFFNWYYFTFTFAMMVSLTLIVYLQSDVSWSLGLAVPAFLMFMSCALFFMGTRIYVRVKPEGSPLKNIAQVVVAAVRKRRLELPERQSVSLFNHVPLSSINSELPHTDQFRCLNKGSILTPEDELSSDGSAANPWRLSSVQKVEEVKCVVRVIPIWAAGIVYYIALFQHGSYSVFQALQSDRRLGSTGFKIPAASYTVFNMLSLTIWIAFYDRILIPLLRRRTGKENGGITLLQKMGAGMVLSVITMILAALVEDRRRTLALTEVTVGNDPRRGAISSMSGMWLVPQLALLGISEGLTAIGQVEFFYKQFPENMRSIGGAFFFCGMAASNYSSSFLVSMVHRVTGGTRNGNWLPEDLNKGRLDYFYYLIAAMGIVNLVYFLACAKWYKYKGFNGSTLQVEVSEEEMQPHKPLV